jgi:hypothetical protein
MKTKILIVLFMVSILFLAGCGTEEAAPVKKDTVPKAVPVAKTTGPIDCGIKDSCFLEQLASCNPATFTTGMGPKIQFDLTIRGAEGNKCIIHYLASENPMPQFKNTEMTCKIPLKAYTIEEYEDYFQNNLLTVCQGTYVDAMRALGIE